MYDLPWKSVEYSDGINTFYSRFITRNDPVQQMRLNVKINHWKLEDAVFHSEQAAAAKCVLTKFACLLHGEAWTGPCPREGAKG